MREPAAEGRSGQETGVLVVNLGTPEAPSAPAVRRYLRQFLSDPRVVRTPRWVWLPILHGLVLPRRAPRVARLYGRIWTAAGSPLLVHSRAATQALARRLGSGWRVVLGMRYGTPSLDDALGEIRAAGCERIVVLPLFPQFSETTTGTVEAELARLLVGEPLAWRLVPPYHDDETYVDALAVRIEECRGEGPVDFHVFSFHGLPQSYVDAGDPYLEHCRSTAQALARRLDLEPDRWRMVFQSRFGPARWLEPAMNEFVDGLAPARRRVLVAMPGFGADCLETLEEVGVAQRDSFRARGGEELLVVPALNDSPRWIDALEGLVRRCAGDWRTGSGGGT